MPTKDHDKTYADYHRRHMNYELDRQDALWRAEKRKLNKPDTFSIVLTWIVVTLATIAISLTVAVQAGRWAGIIK